MNRVPIMAQQVLDLYALFRLVTAKGGLVEVINRKVWREVTRGLNLPTTITSAAFLPTHPVRPGARAVGARRGSGGPGAWGAPEVLVRVWLDRWAQPPTPPHPVRS